MQTLLGRTPEVSHRYKNATNGMALLLTPDEADLLAVHRHAGVAACPRQEEPGVEALRGDLRRDPTGDRNQLLGGERLAEVLAHTKSNAALLEQRLRGAALGAAGIVQQERIVSRTR